MIYLFLVSPITVSAWAETGTSTKTLYGPNTPLAIALQGISQQASLASLRLFFFKYLKWRDWLSSPVLRRVFLWILWHKLLLQVRQEDLFSQARPFQRGSLSTGLWWVHWPGLVFASQRWLNSRERFRTHSPEWRLQSDYQQILKS